MGFLNIRTLVIAALFFSGKIWADAPKNAAKTTEFTRYQDLQSDVLNVIGEAQKYLLVATDQFHDGELSAAIFLANYRGVQVKVLLNQNFSKNLYSRYEFFRTQNIPVGLVKADIFQKPNSKSFLILKDQVITYSCAFSELLTCKKPQKIAFATTLEENWFNSHFPQAQAADGGKSRWKEEAPRTGYVYKRNHAKPQEVPTVLPKATKWQIKEKAALDSKEPSIKQ